ncbi:PREDICTED: la protein 2-like isoform X2 [Camelina sativa]|uniref:La protein 2-like isoform X2 n=1 Tax=Camelina sativa TaxID=90675 RepID=A0ABM0WM05_CAMSA|nr:PREDICTED: la protein 2-like isoform X2 [Camelina sativa]
MGLSLERKIGPTKCMDGPSNVWMGLLMYQRSNPFSSVNVLSSLPLLRLLFRLQQAAMASFNEETARKLLTQVEFYFSDSNLPRDDFLNREVTKSKDGLVSLRLVCSFSRMRNLLGLGNNIKREDIPLRILEDVATLLRTSHFLKVSNNGLRIGRGTKLTKPEEVLEQVHRRTLAASPFEYSIKMDDVASFFSQYAKVNSVRLPHHIADKRHFCGTALVEFSSEQDTEFILRQSLVYAGADLVLIPKSDFDCQRDNLIKLLGISGSSPRDTSHNEFGIGQLVKFTLKWIASGENITNKEKPRTLNINIREKEDKETCIAERLEETDRKKEGGKERVNTADQLAVPPWNTSDSLGSEVLKDVFQRFGSVKHIEYSRGLDSGYVCFIDSETATKARAAAEFVGGLVVKNNFSIALEAVNGEIERELWKRLSSAEPEGEGKEGDIKEKGKDFESAQPIKKARKEP